MYMMTASLVTYLFPPPLTDSFYFIITIEHSLYPFELIQYNCIPVYVRFEFSITLLAHLQRDIYVPHASYYIIDDYCCTNTYVDIYVFK